MTDPETLVREVERLRRENEELDEQVKLLVQTEQRQYRLRGELDRQLDRIKALGEFALKSSRADSTIDVLGGAARLLGTLFDLDDACAGYVEKDPGRLRLLCVDNETIVEYHREVDSALVELLAAQSGALVCRLDSDDHNRHVQPLVDVFGALPGRSASPLGVVACVALHDEAGAIIGCLLARGPAERRRSFFGARLAEAHVPYLELLATYVERAIQTDRLTDSLRDRSRQLADANEQLTSSLESLERTQQQLVQAQKMEAIGRLAGGVAHDFNNLLTVILSHAELLESELPHQSSARDDAARIGEAATRAAKITNQLLAFSRRQKRTPEIVDLSVLVNHMTQMLGRLIGEHISLELRTDPAVGCIKADPSQLEQIVLNLVVNARDAMSQGGTLVLETRPAKPDEAADWRSQVALVVRDNGEGMDAATRAQIFEPFFTTKRPGKGTGLGLATVYGLVKQNEGQITVVSEVDRGTAFTVCFPRVTESPVPTPLDGPHAERESAATILLVEDEASIRRVTARILERFGYEVLEALDGEHALHLAGRPGAEVDLLLTDVVMPRMGGPELAEKLRAAYPKVRVLFMSGYAFDEPASDVLDSCLQKPFTSDMLLEHVRAALA